jgi:hypothetical protein
MYPRLAHVLPARDSIERERSESAPSAIAARLAVETTPQTAEGS